MNLFSLAKTFPTEEAAIEYWIQIRWPNGVRCLACDHDKVYRIETKGKTGKPCLLFECAECELHFSPTTGTLFHDSHLPMQKWFAAIALMVEAKKGISANQIKRHIGVTYKTAWHLCHRIRKAMSEVEIDPLGGQGQIVEIDESFVGGRAAGKGVYAGMNTKVKVLGIAERGGRVHLQKVNNSQKSSLKPVIDAHLSPNVKEVRTDGAALYSFLIPTGKHVPTNHREELRKNGQVSNKTIEGAFSLFKRGIVGSYHKIDEVYMDAYLQEFCWRYNRRKQQSQMFDMALNNLSQRKPLPYKTLKGGDF
jgi:transposase-like protein